MSIDKHGCTERILDRRRKAVLLQNALVSSMNSDEIKSRTFEIIDSSEEELISFLREYIRHRSINPKRQIASVENGETPASQNCLNETRKPLRESESLHSCT